MDEALANDVQRFVLAQENANSFQTAVDELTAGKKDFTLDVVGIPTVAFTGFK
ncbi:hypothetical protein [Weissella sp. LMG 11983]|uniref:hypothetical protein n=1 Tax=Weissella sp. LMG 11983 TaxID=2987700 RepID=UPI0021F81553|nr:hypothetical protein [Weissella sp. LMG 11983]MCW0927233.1 hypothetical protein [Weissella sp. LMG 11983]